MMCKNESALIRTALKSVKHLIDKWSIIDTGSTDGTQAVIHEEMAGIPGTLFERPWIDWAHNRSEVVQFAKLSGCDWILILDADETFLAPPDFKWPELNPNIAYWATILYGSITYDRPNLFSAKQNWHYVGVTHEYLTAEPDHPGMALLPCKIFTNPARTDKTPEKCMQDVHLLEADLITDPNNVRSIFYLAQSYKDAGNVPKALENYERRTKMGGWYEEAWYAHFQIAILKERMQAPAAEVISAYLEAYENNPARAESLGSLARYLRLARKYNLAYQMASIAKDIPEPNERLFLDHSYYTWRCLDEFAVSAFWVGKFRESAEHCKLLLSSKDLPPHEKERVEKNLAFALAKLPQAPVVKQEQPLVSAIMLTKNRARYVPQAINCFLQQTYTNSELIILDDGNEPVEHLVPKDPRISYRHVGPVRTIGTKRNMACTIAKGDIIVSWDDDDWSHPLRIESQVKRLQACGRQMTGYNRILYWDEINAKAYKFIDPKIYACGASQCFWKTWWEKHPYLGKQTGEDQKMAWTAAKLNQLDCEDGRQMLVARVHAGNTWKPPLAGPMFPECDRAEFPAEFFAAI